MNPIALLLLSSLAVAAAQEPVAVPAQPGSVRLRPDDFTLVLDQTATIEFTLPADLQDRQYVLAFRARVDNPATIGSVNGVFLTVNGQPVRLSTPARELRLLNKPPRFAWTTPPTLDWFLVRGEWRLVYAPDFEILLDRPYYGPEAYAFELDVTDLVQPGRNTLRVQHAANADIAKNAGSDLTIYFRDLRLEVRDGPGVRGVSPELPPEPPYVAGRERSAPLEIATQPGPIALRIRGHDYRLTSRFSAPGADGNLAWLPLEGDHLDGPGWTLARRLIDRSEDGRLTIEDTFTNVGNEPVGIRCQHDLIPAAEDLPPRISFGGREEADLTALHRASAPWIFLGWPDHGVGLAAADDVLRQHALLTYDNERRAAGLHDDWFGLPPGGSYTTRFTVYATDTANVFDLVNLIRDDWLTPFEIEGGITFFEPDAVLAADETMLRDYLTRMNISIAMSQGGWVDRQRVLAGDKNLAHGPMVWSDEYAEYRVRLKRAMEKLRAIRPGLRCLVYFDPWLVTGDDLAETWADSLWRKQDGTPFRVLASEAFGTNLAYVIPTLENSLGREILSRLPGLYLDELGADGLYWDEMSREFVDVDYGQPDGHSYRIDPLTGKIVAAAGAPELASLPFKLALLKAFWDRGATVVANTTPTTMTEQEQQFTRFNENSVPRYPGLIQKCWNYTPVAYAGWSTYKEPGVDQAAFLADIKDKLDHACLYLFSTVGFYPLFTHENLATYEYPLTPLELDHGVIVGRERILASRSGTFGWPGEAWRGELLRFDADQRVRSREPVAGDGAGLVKVDVPAGEAIAILRAE